MAKSSLTGSMKFKALVRTLGIPAPHVLGHLEFMWKPAYESGNPTFRSHEMIELAAEWSGEPGVFAKAVCDPAHNFVDARKNDQFEIHDFYEHAPDYVKKRIEREKQRKRNVVKRRSVKTYSGGQNPPTADNGGKSPPDETRRDEANEAETRQGKTNQAEPNRDEAEACPPLASKPESATGIGAACSHGSPRKAQDEIENLAQRFADLEANPNQRNTSMWRQRVRDMGNFRGGLVRCDEILNEIESRRNPRVAKTKGFSTDEIKNESAWANQQTREWISQQGKSA